MVEKTISDSFWISEQHQHLKVKLTLRAEASEIGDVSVEIHMEPSLISDIPDYAQDQLFFRGICDGVNAAVAHRTDAVNLSDFEVHVLELTLSDDLSAYSPDEMITLSRKLRSMAQELMSDMIKEMVKN